MSFISCYEAEHTILMEGALGERLKREYHLANHEFVVLADMVYREDGRKALREIWSQYIDVAKSYRLPFIATTPTRRADRERVIKAGYDQNIISDNVRY